MTTMVIIDDFLIKYKLDPKKIKVNVLSCCVTHRLGGTSAELLENDTLSVYELLHGMMLPSGNDAAQALAIYFGHLHILLQQKGTKPDVDANIKMDEFEKEEEELPESENDS